MLLGVAPPLFHIVLHEPEIPNNTGNIGRTCVATGCALHLIHPLGFDTSEKACRRAGLDYWPRLKPREHQSWESFSEWSEQDSVEQTLSGADHCPRIWLFSTKGAASPWDVKLEPGDRFVFGKETAGLPTSILENAPESILTLPLVPGERSLNVATAVCAAIYEGIRQCRTRGDDIGW